MGHVWVVVLGVALVCVAVRVAVPLALGGRRLPKRLENALATAAPALMAALVVTLLWPGRSGPSGTDLAAKLAGFAVAAALLFVRRSLLLALVVAALVTAGLRLLLG